MNRRPSLQRAPSPDRPRVLFACQAGRLRNAGFESSDPGRRPALRVAVAIALAVAAWLLVAPALASATIFSNTASITLNDPNSQNNGNNNATATPYPSKIVVSGVTGTLSSVTLTLNSVSYSFSQDLDVLLVGPGGQTLIPVDNLGPDVGAGEAASNSTLTLSDAGTTPSATTPWGSSSTFKPVSFGGFNQVWGLAAPLPPYGNPGPDTTDEPPNGAEGPPGATFASTFDGINPNGTWSLYVITTAGGDGTGAIAGGWSLNIAAASVAATSTVLSSSQNPSFTSGADSSVALTATVSSTSTVNAGTVDFTDGGTTIPGCGAVSVGSGQATCTNTFTTEGSHSIEALYSGSASFGASHGSLTQQVNDHTTVTGSAYCNAGSITLNNPPDTTAEASPYPSEVFVSGLSGAITHLTVTLNGATYSHSQDIDVLLVGPAGQTFIPVAAAGPNDDGSLSDVTLTLDDSAATTISSTSAWGAANSTVTSKPVNYGGVNETWGPPAPAGPYGNPGPAGGGTATLGTTFDGTSANGTWSLYVVTTAAGDGTGSIGGGWCANITTANVAATTTTIASNNNPSFTTAPGNSVTFTSTVEKASDNSNVSEGTVDFTSDGVTIPGCGAVAVSAGLASCTTSFSAEGSDTIEALYSGDANFGASNATLTQGVNDHTAVTGNSFCNNGSITLNNPNIDNPEIGATPYPSNIFVTGRPGNLQHLSVTLNGVTYADSQDIDGLLVGPGGQSLILVAAAGPNSGGALSNVTLTLDDNAASTLAANTAWGAANAMVTSKPVNYGGDNEVFGPPAPAGPYGNPGPFGGGTATLGSTFDGSSPNGTWSLYLITTAGGDGTGQVAGGWCLGITSPAPPVLTKTFGAASVPLNGSTSLTFKVSNPNASSSLSGIGFTDTLPLGLVVSTPNGSTGSCGGGTITAVAGSGTVSFSGATLAADANCSFSVNVTGITAGSQVNTTSTVSSNEGGAGAAATATLDVLEPPALSKSFGVPSIALNGSTSLSFTVSNPNAAGSLSGIGFTDTLPAGLVVSTPNGLTTGTCGGGTVTAVAGGSSVTLTGATLSGAASCNFSVNVTGIAVGSQVNTTSTVSSNEGGAGAAATATLDVTAVAPQITKAFGAATIPLNGSTTLSFTITNPTGNGSATGIGFTDTLPSGLVVSTPNGVTGTCGGGSITATAASTTVSLSGATLAGGATCTFSVSVKGTSAGVKNNSVSVSSTNDGTGNTATASVAVLAPPTLSKSFGAPSIALNGSTSLSFTVTNPNAAGSLSGIGFTDTLPAGLVVSTPNGLTTGTCGGGTVTAVAGGTSVTLTGATLAAAANCQFSVNVTGIAAGVKSNTTSTVSSNEGGTGAAATATLTVNAGPPQITKAFGAATVPLNGSTTLSFTITNPVANGSSTGIGFTDTLPSGLVVSTPNGLTGTCGGGSITATAASNTVSLSGATLAAGASCTFSVSVTGTSAGVKNNSVTVSSTNGGTGNTATASVTVVAPPAITKSFAPATIPLGGSTTLSFTVTNPNATASLSGVGFTDNLPTGLVVSTPNGQTGSCGSGLLTATAGSAAVTLNGATLGASASCTLSVSVTATGAGALLNTTSSITSNEGGTGAPASATLTVVAPPVIAKSFGAADIALGGTTSLTFTVTNPAENTVALTGVAFTDTLPSGLVVATPSAAASTCADIVAMANAGSGTASASGILLPVGASCTFSLNVTGTTSGTKLNSVTVTSTNGGTGNTATASVGVALPPQISKSFGAAAIPLNGSTTLSFTVTNPAANGSFGLTGVGFTDSLPAGLVVSTPNGLTGSCGGGSITATAGSGTVSLSGATLAGGASCTFSVSVTGTSAGVKNNSVTVSSTNAGNGNTATASLTVVAPPAITKAFGAAGVPLNGSTSLTFSVTNPNATTSLSGVGFSDTMPSGLVVSTPNGMSGSCGGGSITDTAGSGTITLSGATLAAGVTCTFAVNVTGTTAGSKVNTTSTVTSNEGGSGASATATLVVLGPPQIAKAFGAADIPVGGSTSLTFTITNPNPAGTLTGIAFTDSLPSGLVVSTPSGLTGSCGGGSITATAGSAAVSLSGASLAAAASCSFSVNVTGTSAGVQNNSVTVTSSNGGTGNTATASVAVALPPQIAKAFGAATIPLNGSTTLTFTINNPNTNVSLSGVAFTDSLPAGLVVSNPNGLSGSCGGGSITATSGAGSVALAGATLASSASCSFSVNVTGATAGVKANSVAVSSTTAGPGNTATASLTVVAPPQISKSFGATMVPVGGSTTLTFTITNPNSTVALSGVGFADTFPAGLIVASPNGLSGSCGGGSIGATASSGTVTLSGAALGAGASCSFSVGVTGTTAGVKSNSVTASSTNGGTGSAATASLTVVAPPTIAKAFGAPSIPFGGTTTLTFTLSDPNAGTTLHGVGFTDTLPAGLVVATPNGLTGSCGGGSITATAGGNAVSLSGATIPAAGSCSFAVNVTAIGLGVQNNTTSAVTSTEGGTGGTASASVTVGRAPTTVTVTAAPPSARFGTPITFTASVVPSQPNGSGVSPTGSVSFYLDGQSSPVATVPLSGGTASFTTSGLSVGSHSVVAVYSGDANFLGATSLPATVTVTAASTVTGNVSGALDLPAGSSTLVSGAHISGGIIVHSGASVDIENSTVGGAIDATGPAALRLCGTTVSGSVDVSGATGLVIIGDALDECATNTISGSLILTNNTGGLEAIGNKVEGSVSASGNSGPGPFPGETAPVVSGNGP